MFLKNVITIQLNAPVPLQFSNCLKDAIMYAKHRIGPTCIRIGLKKEREMSFLASSSTSFHPSVFFLSTPVTAQSTATRTAPNSPQRHTSEEELARSAAGGGAAGGI
jgi:hypothetical protein